MHLQPHIWSTLTTILHYEGFHRKHTSCACIMFRPYHLFYSNFIIHVLYYYRALAYIPLTVLAVPASVLTVREIAFSPFHKPCHFPLLRALMLDHPFMLLQFFCQLGGGYLFGLPVGFVADSIGATIGATAAFLLGRTVCIV